MTSRERVLACFSGESRDRVPLNVFAGWNPEVRSRVNEKYDGIDGFMRERHIDIVTGVLPRFPFGKPTDESAGRTLDDFLALDPIDPSGSEILSEGCDAEMDLFRSVHDALDYHREEKAVFVHAWGVFELSQFLFEKNNLPGTQEALMNMIAEKEKSKAIYWKLAEWSAACVANAAKAGADVIELSDDWGQQDTMLFSPRSWREMILPATRLIVDAAREHNVPVLLHSDGDISLILEGLRELGLSGLHPVQESAGMSYQNTRAVLGPDFCIMGGLDTVTALPVMSVEEVRDEVTRVFELMKPNGPFIFAGSHMFQDDAPLEVIEAAYETAFSLAEY